MQNIYRRHDTYRNTKQCLMEPQDISEKTFTEHIVHIFTEHIVHILKIMCVTCLLRKCFSSSEVTTYILVLVFGNLNYQRLRNYSISSECHKIVIEFTSTYSKALSH